MQKKISRLAIILCLASSSVFAASSRSAWVVSDIYNYNHPYAAANSADLATKMQTMDSSAFLFYRGTADIFYRDMATLPASAYTSPSTAYTWLGGDTHLANFGAFQDSGGKAVFGVNDFDEGYLGQYVWDLRRTATSIVLAGRENGLKDSDITTAINTFVAAYLSQLSSVSGNNNEKSFQLTTSNTSSVVKSAISSSAGDKRSDLLSKYTTVSNSKRVFQDSAKLAAVSSATYNAVVAAMGTYVQTISAGKQYAGSYYTVKDVHQKLGSGTGSLGRLRYYALLEGPSSSTSDDVILELKQEAASNVAIAAPGKLPAADYANNEGNRVGRTGKAQLINADVLTGYTSINGLPFYAHEKSPFEEDFDYTQLSSSSKFNTAITYVGQALASAHALADNDYDSSVVPFSIEAEITSAVTSKSGLQAEIASFAFGYADQVNLDWQSFKSAYAAGTPLY
ncbi:MAG: hypothetical protein JWQ61_3 [Collimonas fungivorans]|uniref:DUF2252 domain-containing protein n=1 Tax=Collimonas fungivorans TaxID=158899 RepID=UPI0026EC3F16|nr:DUF2252 family protein [Collimonas fungivorans]MDB5765189.1 hypothetical protein [Collimonas fungivorans]